ncbi:MAG: TIGR03013 family XrtA/PEP-CTERM system glycosyltransferase, partial [Desulfobia sp.]
WLTMHLIHQGAIPEEPLREKLWIRIVVITVIIQLSLYYNNLYEFGTEFRIMDLTLRLLQSIGGSCIFLAALYYIFPSLILKQGIFFVGLIFLLFFLVSWRLAYQFICQKQYLSEKIILVGDGCLAGEISREIRRNLDSGYRIAAFFANPGAPELAQEIGADYYDDYSKLCAVAIDKGVKKIVLALGERRGESPVRNLLECKLYGIRIFEGVNFYERLSGKILVKQTPPSWLIFSDGFHRHRIIVAAKRLMDLFAAGFGLVLSAPVMGITAAAVKLSSPGPVFFFQERTGQRERPFKVIKFRTMRQDAESGTGAVWAEEKDPRITSVGRFLRKVRLDEIPQFWNVLKGEMSFVGPRPERPEFVEQLRKKLPYYGERHSVKPGITGWAQINYGYGASEKDALHKLEYDLFYIKNLSLMFDLFIILKTIKTVLAGNGAR